MREHEEVVLYVGVASHDPAFRALHRDDEDFIRGMSELGPMDAARGFRPILRHGQIVGYGVPIIIADTSEDFREVGDSLYRDIEQAKATVRTVTYRVTPRLEPKLYCLKA